MKTNALFIGATCIALVLSAVVIGQDGDASKPGEDRTEGATYVGGKSCKKCHMKQHRTWRKMKHAKAWAVLKPEYQKMDAKDDDGRSCVSCHVTGWGEADRGGFKDPETSKHLLGVQCEQCHGPGSNHIKAAKKVLDEKRKTFNKGEKTFIYNTVENCSKCHNPHVSHAKYAK